ncbi:MAG TPA: PDZ domain-containing protein [Vicinamibacterales bacterium]|nr:PDZ domain-containing protein [Vicinamibacterales bacterium]
MEPRREGGDVLMFESRGSQLGITISDVDVKASAAGVKIDEVDPDSPAEKAGLKAGDVVVEYDGERVRSVRQFTRLVQETPEGRSVTIALMRDGKRQTVNATPESGRFTWERGAGSGERGNRQYYFRGMPDFDFEDRLPRRFEYRMPNGVFRFPEPGWRVPAGRGRLGVTVQSITPELAEYFGAKDGGALVSSVTIDSAASKAGIKAGDVIVSVNGQDVRDSDDLLREIDGITGEATIVVLRDKKQMTLKATLETPRERSRPRVIL